MRHKRGLVHWLATEQSRLPYGGREWCAVQGLIDKAEAAMVNNHWPWNEDESTTDATEAFAKECPKCGAGVGIRCIQKRTGDYFEGRRSHVERRMARRRE